MTPKMKKMIVNGLVLVAMGSSWTPWTETPIRNLTSLIPFVKTIEISLLSHKF